MIGADGPPPGTDILRPASHEIVLTEVVPDFLPLESRYHCRHLPVILLLGTHGSDKTVLLKEIRDSCAERIPCVLRDLDTKVQARPHELAMSLAYGFGAKVQRFGRLRFPRLILGLIVIHERINRHNRAAAAADIKRLLKSRGDIERKATAIISKILPGLVTDQGLRAVLTVALVALEALPGIQSFRILRSRPARWYASAPGLRSATALDALIELNWQEAENTPRARAQVDEVLCAAFLADLRAAFGGGLRMWARDESCLALFDHADSSSVEAFIETLVTVRQRRRRGPPEQDGDPLVVLAASHTRFPAFAVQAGPYPSIRRPEEARFAEWSRSLDHRPASWLYPVGLVDFDADGDDREDPVELTALAHQWPGTLTVDYAAAFVRRLTDGHPWGSRLVLRGININAKSRPPESVDLRGVLDWPDPDQPGRTLAEGAVARLLMGEQAELREDLITCAAAGDLSSGSCRAALGEEATAQRLGRLRRFCDGDRWVLANGPPRLHPFLRRVLLHRLARRDFAHSHSWLAVHGRLRRHYQREHPDAVSEAHHAFALGDPIPGLAHLSTGFVSADKPGWLRQLYAITCAPRLVEPRVDGTPLATPEDEAGGLASGVIAEMDEWASKATTDIDALAHLVVSVRISMDPLGDPGRTLDSRIADALGSLGKYRGLRHGVLLDEADRYRLRGQRGRWPAAWPLEAARERR